MKRIIGFEIPENQKPIKLDLGDEMKDYFDKLFKGKNHIDYLKEFLITEKNYKIVKDAIDKAKQDALPLEIKNDCLYCNNKSDDENDKKCNKYYAQMNLTYGVALSEYIKIVLNHKHIYQNKKLLLKLTEKFIKCFSFINGKGLMYFDIDELIRHTLSIGFLSISQIFSNSKVLNNLKDINLSLNSIDEEKSQNKILKRKDYYYLDLQKEFFENKQRFYKEQLFIEEKEPISKKSLKKLKHKKVSIVMYALYFHYLQQSGDYPYFENHPMGKLTAIDELLKKQGIETSPKYFQTTYNKLTHFRTNRVAYSQKQNIDFVIKNMLKKFPKAIEIAQSELNEILSKSKYH